MDARVGYQPFSATHGPSGGFDTGGEDMDPEPAVSMMLMKNKKRICIEMLTCRSPRPRKSRTCTTALSVPGTEKSEDFQFGRETKEKEGIGPETLSMFPVLMYLRRS